VQTLDKSRARAGPRVFIFSQVYRPDPAAVGQYLAALGSALAARGADVTVLTARRGYDDPSIQYPRQEWLDQVQVLRRRGVSFGKASTLLRMAAALSFSLQSMWYALRITAGSVVVVSTVPPFLATFMALLARVRRYRLVYWVMDLNPDQLIALGSLRADSLVGRVLRRMSAIAVRGADLVVALDEFMADRLRAYGATSERTTVLPLWPLASPATSAAGRSFRRAHGLEECFVVMYSGNHTRSNPLDTLLEAARELADHSEIRFVFVGGGNAKRDVAAFVARHELRNALLLPYQPLEDLGESLAAADLHVVTMGDPMAGVIHPSKVYSALGVGRPVLYIGPERSHLTALVAEEALGWHVPHGEGGLAARAILAAHALSPPEREDLGRRATALIERQFSERVLLARLTAFIEALAGSTRASGASQA
jgi:glycosyltransferase involved in cell wall biosynthesis